MTNIDAAVILRRFNDWRRYDGPPAEQPAMPKPRDIGEAIEVACRVLCEHKDG